MPSDCISKASTAGSDIERVHEQTIGQIASYQLLLGDNPFLDGNGRIGPLLIAALLESWELLNEPLMYLSGYQKHHQAEYYRRLSAVRTDGDWESWIVFFLEDIVAASAEAEKGIMTTASLVASDRRRLMKSSKAGTASYRLLEHLPMMPRFTITRVQQLLDTSFPTANAALTSSPP